MRGTELEEFQWTEWRGPERNETKWRDRKWSEWKEFEGRGPPQWDRRLRKLVSSESRKWFSDLLIQFAMNGLLSSQRSLLFASFRLPCGWLLIVFLPICSSLDRSSWGSASLLKSYDKILTLESFESLEIRLLTWWTRLPNKRNKTVSKFRIQSFLKVLRI